MRRRPTGSSTPPLLTYAHQTGTAGGELIPGLATALPKISNDGKTYTLTLRKGLKYSDGRPVKASDFRYTIQRCDQAQLGRQVVLHELHRRRRRVRQRQGRARSPASQTDDATGKITIKLIKPYGAFPNVLAFPSAGLVPDRDAR